MDEAASKFRSLQKYITFLDGLNGQMRAKGVGKYEKTQKLYDILTSNYNNQSLKFLENIEAVIKELMQNYRRKLKHSTKSDRIDLPEIKMENDFQSPESPPSMHYDAKVEKEPITIPTERRDSNSYINGAVASTSSDVRRHADRDERNDKRYYERRHRDWSRGRSSRSRSINRSRSRSRSYDRKRHRYSRSHSRERDRSRRRERDSRSLSRSRSRERRHGRSRRSPSYHSRSKSPYRRSGHERKDDRKYETNRKYQPDYDRKYDNKRHPMRASFPPKLNRHSFKTTHVDNFKHETDRTESKPCSRFAQGKNADEEFNFMRDFMKDDDIDELGQKTLNMFGRTEKAEKLKKHFAELDEIDMIKKRAEEVWAKKCEEKILNVLQSVGELDALPDEEPENSPENGVLERQNTSQNNEFIGHFSDEGGNNRFNRMENRIENRMENRFDSRIDAQIDLDNRIDERINNRVYNRNENRFDFRVDSRPDNRIDPLPDIPADIRVENRMENRVVTIMEPNGNIRRSIENQPSFGAITSTTPAVPERIALSDKYRRRPRISNEGMPEPTPPMSAMPQPNQQQMPRPPFDPTLQDPRLRNRGNPAMPNAGATLTEQFMSFGNAQPQPHQPPHHLQFDQMHHSPFDQPHHPQFEQPHHPQYDQHMPANPFGGNRNAMHQMQRPFFNDSHHQPPHRNAMPSRQPHYMENNYPQFDGNSPIQYPRHIPFSGHSNMGGPERAKETYADHRRRKAEERKKLASVTSTTVAPTENAAVESTQEPVSENPAEDGVAQNKETDKEKTVSSNSPKKTHFDKAFRSNNWDALAHGAKKNNFRIPKLNKPTSTVTSENSVSTSTKTKKDNRQESGKAESQTKSKKPIEASKKPKAAKKSDKSDQNGCADTTIITEADRTEKRAKTPEPEQPKPVEKPNTEQILELIKDICPQEKILDIRKILAGTTSNDNAVTSSTQPAQSKPATSKLSQEKQSKAENKTLKPKKHHSNELERLTADIRENIPGVLYATGRRTCTLNAQKTIDTSPPKTKTKATVDHKSDDETICDKAKPSARIVRRRMTTHEQRPVIHDSDDDNGTDSTEAVPLISRIKITKNPVRRPRQNPVQGIQNKPANQVPAFDVSTPPVKRKPGPKSASKIQPTDLTESDLTLAVNLPKCTVVLEKVEKVEDMVRVTRAAKRKFEQLNSSSDSCDKSKITDKTDSTEKNAELVVQSENTEQIEPSQSAVTVSDSQPDAKQAKISYKNTDKTHTTKSKKCVICDKPYKHLTNHYVTSHGGIEVFSSRISVKMSNKLRCNAPKNGVYEGGKITAYCYYCESDLKFNRFKWIQHLIRHTGEYTRYCTKCGITVTPNIDKSSCSHTDPKLVAMVNYVDTLYVYMCNFCNYTQGQEENLKNHLADMHEVTKTTSKQYEKIVLIPNLRRQPVAGPSTVASIETDVTSIIDDLPNANVFKPTNQEDDRLSQTFKIINESAFTDPATIVLTAPLKTIVDRLSERFKKQSEATPAVKQEDYGVVIRSPKKTLETSNNPNESTVSPVEVKPLISQIPADEEQGWESLSSEGEEVDEEMDEEDEDDDETPAPKPNTFRRFLTGKHKITKGRIRGKKRPIPPPTAVKQEPSVKLEQTLPSKDEKRLQSIDGKRVDNIVFVECSDSNRYHCYIGDCDFVSKNNANSLSNHLRQKHNEPWTGYCYTCDKQIRNGNFSLTKEFDHLIQFHVPNAQMVPAIKVPEPEKLVIQEPKADDPSRPIIRLRRLSGDKLSHAAQTLAQQSELKITTVTTDQARQLFMPEGEGALENPLKPWTKCTNTKTASAQIKLKRDCSIATLFKCMGIDCIFATSDSDKMLKHLNNHEDFCIQQASTSKHHSDQDHSSWLECCYCEEMAGSCTLLVEHIRTIHATSIFQCSHCFYRSVDRGNVVSHMKRYHPMEVDKYILVCGSTMRSLCTEIDAIVSSFSRCEKMPCIAGCSKSFMYMSDLNQHFDSQHPNEPSFKCSVCLLVVTKSEMFKHLFEHELGLCHCAYCAFAGRNVESMRAHLRDVHPNRLAYGLVRLWNGPPISKQQPSISYFGDTDTAIELVHCSVTDEQLNFMDPSLAEYATNAGDPPEYNDMMAIRVINKERFIEMQKYEEERAQKVKQTFKITSIASSIPANKISIPERQLVAKVAINNISIEKMSPASSQSSNAPENAPFETYVQTVIDTAAKTFATGIEKQHLFRCAVPDCTWVRSDEREFLLHLMQHQGGDYRCFHCQNVFTLPLDLKNHIKTHLKLRFFCFYCDMMGSTQIEMNTHFESIHKETNHQFMPLNVNNYDLESDLFVVCPQGSEDIYKRFISRLVRRSDQRMEDKKTYMPEEVAQLPTRQIFTDEIQCGRCFFSNKVRSNLVRHFKNGCNEQQVPVNPVPCLNTTERHFDKMRNLAASSNSTNPTEELGKFVAEDKRYVCGAKSCKYQTISAENLKQHIVTLHASETCFDCPHCDATSSNSGNEFLNHLRYHESKIFKCPFCLFIHYLKQYVDKHINDLHPNTKERAITLDRSAKKAEVAKPSPKSITYKWSCGICTNTFDTKPFVKAHLSETHRLSHQFKCSICLFSHDTKTEVKNHLASVHGETDPTQIAQKIKSHYDKVEFHVDNTPLWRRDDPTRIKHIRGILLDDDISQENNKKSVQLDAKAVKATKPSAANAQKKARASDDSVLDYRVTTKEIMDRVVQQKLQKFDVVARAGNNDDRFMIVPPKDNVEEEARPRPASLRQQPKRRFSMYVSSSNDFQPSTSGSQPPISLRLKRISDPVGDGQKMPPPKLVRVVSVKKVEKVDLTTMDLVYACSYCKIRGLSFDSIQQHWLNDHKKNDNDPIAKRFSYRISRQVKCVFCTAQLTFYTIKSHMQVSHPTQGYAFAKYCKEPSDTIECGICGAGMQNIPTLQQHFCSDHPQTQQISTKIEPLPFLNDAIVEALLQHGDRGTFKCSYCYRFYPCRYDYEQHHKKEHSTAIPRYETNGKEVIKYGCTNCRDIYTDEKLALGHLRSHIKQSFQCLYCPKKEQDIKLIQMHHQLIHKSNEPGYRRENLNSFYEMTLTFSNGLTLTWGDLLHTKYGGVERLLAYINDLNKVQLQQLKSTNAANPAPIAAPTNNASRINRRRQTLL